MLKNFWYACESSSAVTDKPKQVLMFNQRFALYRNPQGQVVALNDQCPHRGAALSLGWLEDGCIRCPYHAWKFEPDGKCIDIPANAPGTPIPRKAQVETYDVQEKYGFIWLFYGDLPDAERPPIPPLPEFDDPTLHRSYLDFQVNTHYTRVLENSLDISHLPIVHVNSFGAGFKGNLKVDDYEVQPEGWGLSATTLYKNYTKPKGLFQYFVREEKSDLESKVSFYPPNITKIESNSGRIRIINFAIHLPVSDTVTISKRILFRSFARFGWLDPIFLKYYAKIYGEDSAVSESQLPTVVPPNLADEVHVASDAMQIAYRKLHQKYATVDWNLKADQRELDASNGANGHSTPAVSTALVG